MARNHALYYYISCVASIAAVSAIVILHELCHYALCLFFHVDTPQFSIGFGPAIPLFTFAKTTFQVGVIPLGGYVAIDQKSFMVQPFIHQLCIMSGGIIGNMVIGTAAIIWGQRQHRTNHQETEFFPNAAHHSRFIGPIGIVVILQKAIMQKNKYIFWTLWGAINTQIGLFNILPFPILDGGHIVLSSLKELATQLSSHNPSWMIIGTTTLVLIIIIMYTLWFLKQLIYTDDQEQRPSYKE